MSKEFIPYEEALALKELGMTCVHFGGYSHPELPDFPKPFLQTSDEGEWDITAPLYQQAFRWFREEHDLHIGICHQVNGKFDCWTNKGNLLENGKYCDIDSYEEAELACLRKLIETVNQNEDELD